MKKFVRVPTRCALAMAVGLAIASPGAYGAGLGRIAVKSALGQPLRAEVEVTSISRDEAASLAVRLASATAYRQANLEMNPALTGLRVSLERRGDNGYLVRLTSPTPVNEPFLDLLLELTSNNGRVLREYTILLDPPALRTQPDIVAPATAARPAAPAPTASAPAASAPPPAGAAAPTPAPAAAPSAAPAAAAGSTAAGSTYTVQRGDTLGAIAERTRPASASLDQMLVGLFRANPEAFQEQNMNLLRAGSVLKVPSAAEVTGVEAAAARREVVAQSADFARYRSRLAQATGAAVPQGSAAVGTGQVTARVQDSSSTATPGDQLKIGQGSPAAKATDEAVARDRAIQELQARVQELERTNQQLQRALELQSKTGAQAQGAAESKAGTAQPAPAPAVTAAAPPPAPAAAPTAAPTPAPSAPAATTAPAPAPAPVPAPSSAAAPAKKAAPAPAPAESPGFFADSMLPIVGGIAAVIVALLGLLLMRRRKSKAQDDFDAMSDAARGNSLFGQTGGRSVDTGATSSFNSSFIPAASQMDSTEVDPVAEADVYIAYGREEQAEDILKESLRNNPDRHAARVKLMEIIARRGDKAAFAAMATDLKARTGGEGEDWDRAIAMGRSLDPSNPLFAGAIAAETTSRGPTTEIRFGPTTRGTPTGGGGFKAPPATLGGDEGADSVLDFSTTAMRDPVLPGEKEAASASDSLMSHDSRLGLETFLPLDALNTSLPPSEATAESKKSAGDSADDLSALEFEALNTMPATRIADEEEPLPLAEQSEAMDFKLDPIAKSAAPQFPAMPDLDLNLPPVEATAASSHDELVGGFDFAPTRGGARPSKSDAGPPSGFRDSMPRRANLPPLEDALSRPSLLGDLGALPEESATRLASNTDQATVPLIDFDLSGADAPLTGSGRSATPTGSPMASQMATKLDLARGYIDLGVKDGARELLEEVMRDGTREQRQEAVELLKQAER